MTGKYGSPNRVVTGAHLLTLLKEGRLEELDQEVLGILCHPLGIPLLDFTEQDRNHLGKVGTILIPMTPLSTWLPVEFGSGG
jgi:hypothetical protein